MAVINRQKLLEFLKVIEEILETHEKVEVYTYSLREQFAEKSKANDESFKRYLHKVLKELVKTEGLHIKVSRNNCKFIFTKSKR